MDNNMSALTNIINDLIVLGKKSGMRSKDISDSYHTFGDLYHHRMVLTAALFHSHKDICWKSWLHHDGSMFDGMFIVGIDTPDGQYTYHYNANYWDMFDLEEKHKAPLFDGHKPEDVGRLLSLHRLKGGRKRYENTRVKR